MYQRGIKYQLGRIDCTKRQRKCEMKEKGTEIIVNFIVRAVLGAAVIFFVNQFLGISENSGCGGAESTDSFDRRNPWNSWGGAPLRDCLLKIL